MIYLIPDHLDKSRTIRFFDSLISRVYIMSHFDISIENTKEFNKISSSISGQFKSIVNTTTSTSIELISNLNGYILEFFNYINAVAPDINKSTSPILIKDKQITLINKLQYFNKKLNDLVVYKIRI